MGYTCPLLDDVRAQLAPDDAALTVARERRDAVLRAADGFVGVLRSFRSGSLAHGTANCPVHHRDKGLDGDCGVVLDRRTWWWLGPDSQEQGGPTGDVGRLREYLRTQLAAEYPHATYTVTKRAILVQFHEPLRSGEDPSVDLVMALTRVDQPGLWIPNTQTDQWDASHPERHTELLTADPKALRVVRARAIRLAKAENKRTATVPLCSFNIEAFGLTFVEPGMDVATALLTLWRRGAWDLAERLTPDPAGVSAPIRVADRVEAVRRLDAAATRLADALDRDQDGEHVRTALRPLWPEFIAASPQEATKARVVASTRAGVPLRVASTGVLATGVGTALKQPRSFGDPR